MSQAIKKTVLYIVEDKKSAQYRYRCKNVKQALEKGGSWQVEVFLKSELGKAEKLLNDAELVVIERQTSKDGVMPEFIKKAHQASKRVLFDLDDLIFDYKELPVLMKSTNSKNVFYWVGYFWGIRRIAKRVDGFIVTNDFLGKKIKRTFKKPYRVIRNSLDDEQIRKAKELTDKNRKEFLVGYFSGSPTHTNDFRMVEQEISRFLEKHEDAKLLVVGYMDFSKQAKSLIENGRIRVMQPVGYLELLSLMAGVDVNIAPLLINDFTNCKSELKFFEAGLVKTTTVASPTYSFKNSISDGENGFLAKSNEWHNKLDYLYSHPEENKRIAKIAREYALENYTGKVFLKEIEEAYDYFTK